MCVYGQFRFDLEPAGHGRERLGETPRQKLIAGQHVSRLPPEEGPDNLVQYGIAELVPPPIYFAAVRCPRNVDEI